MNALLRAALCALALAAGRLGPHASAAEPRGATEVATPHFRLTLPAGWRVVHEHREPAGALGTTHRGAVALVAKSEGHFVILWFACPETEVTEDWRWNLVADATGRAVARVEERQTCTEEDKRRSCDRDADEDAEDHCWLCGYGDRHLDVWATWKGSAPFHGYAPCLWLGAAGDDADRAPLRAIARSLRVVGAVEQPAPEGLPELTKGSPTGFGPW